MPRITNSQRTQRTAVKSSDVANSLSASMRPMQGSAQSNTWTELGSALGAAMPVIGTALEMDRDSEYAAAAADHATGGTDAENRHWAYLKASTTLEARSAFALDQPLIDQLISEIDIDSTVDPKAFNGELDKIYSQFYNGMDRDQAEVLVPLLSDHRAKALQGYGEYHAEKTFQKQAGELSVIAEATLRDGSFTYDAFNAEVKGIFANGTQANSVMFSTLLQKSIELGRPDILENIPDRWTNGQASFKNIPEYEQKINAGIAQATTVATRKSAAAWTAYTQGHTMRQNQLAENKRLSKQAVWDNYLENPGEFNPHAFTGTADEHAMALKVAEGDHLQPGVSRVNMQRAEKKLFTQAQFETTESIQDFIMNLPLKAEDRKAMLDKIPQYKDGLLYTNTGESLAYYNSHAGDAVTKVLAVPGSLASLKGISLPLKVQEAFEENVFRATSDWYTDNPGEQMPAGTRTEINKAGDDAAQEVLKSYALITDDTPQDVAPTTRKSSRSGPTPEPKTEPAVETKTPPQAAIDALKANPKLRDAFNAKYPGYLDNKQ